MRVFLVGAVTSPGEAAPVKEQDSITIAAEGDAAKRAGRVALEDLGYSVRTLSWSPTSKGGVELLAYVTKKGA